MIYYKNDPHSYAKSQNKITVKIVNVCKIEKLIETYKELRKEIERELFPSGIIPKKFFITESAYKNVLRHNSKWLSRIKDKFFCKEGIRIEEDNDCTIHMSELEEVIFHLGHHIASMKWRVALYYIILPVIGLGLSVYFGWLNNPTNWENLFIAGLLVVPATLALTAKNKFDLHISIYEEIVILLEYRLKIKNNSVFESASNDS